MRSISETFSETPSAPGDEGSIIIRREIEPLLSRAKQALMQYSYAMNCSAAVFDAAGSIIEIQGNNNQQLFCNSCKITHSEALAKSRQSENSCIYLCPAGYVFWTSPLYRNGQYAGALAAGQVFTEKPKDTSGKLIGACKDKAEASSKKNHDEIAAMARLLDVCAKEISEKNNADEEITRCISRQLKKPENSREKERLLLAAFRRGDTETGIKILKELMDNICAAFPAHQKQQGRVSPLNASEPANISIIRFRAVELFVLLSRAAVYDDTEKESQMETNKRNLKRILESQTPEAVIENLQHAAMHTAAGIFSFQGLRHASVLRRAERYIWENYSRKLSLEEIARAAGLSPPYFCSIFKAEMGENLSAFINRLRIERAEIMLTETVKPIKEIAVLCGFEDQGWFSKKFKSFTGMSPGSFREQGGR